MEQDWTNTFSPPDRSGAMFFQELSELLAASTTPNHPSVPIMNQSGKSQSNTPNNNFLDQENFYLQQNYIETSLYDSQNGTPIAAHNTPLQHATPNGNIVHRHHHLEKANGGGAGAANGHQLPVHSHHQSTGDDFSLDNLDFILPEELHYENGHALPLLRNPTHQSTAFPPGFHPPQTPSMLAKKGKPSSSNGSGTNSNSNGNGNGSGGGDGGFASPILPSQNDKSYNEQHFFHKQQFKNRSHRSSIDSSSATPFQHHQPNHIRPDAIFTPLVSPAVTPLESQMNLNKHQSQPGSTIIAPVQAIFEPLTSPALNAQLDKRRTSSSIFAPHNEEKQIQLNKRKTPHGTPILQAVGRTSSLSNIKQSPSVKAITALGSTFDKLPEASVDPLLLNKTSLEGTPMLPPQGKKIEIKKETPTMMGFTMGRLAEQQINSNDHNNNDNNTVNNTNDSERPKPLKRLSYSKGLTKVKSTSSCETSPLLAANSGEYDSKNSSSSNNGTKKGETGQPTKKASHKVAEQGRRNRMNVAIHELATLIPQKYHDEVSIPSKATTVELASKYITDLLEELSKKK